MVWRAKKYAVTEKQWIAKVWHFGSKVVTGEEERKGRSVGIRSFLITEICCYCEFGSYPGAPPSSDKASAPKYLRQLPGFSIICCTREKDLQISYLGIN